MKLCRRPAAPAPPPIVWEGDLDDDCSARWRGLILRAEQMDRDAWWWAVFSVDNEDIASCYDGDGRFAKTGAQARAAAERAARAHFDLDG